MKKTLLALLILALQAALAACMPLATPLPPLPTATNLPPTVTPTATPVWFPPTPTFTPMVVATRVITPTVDVQPLFGAVQLSDDFTEEGNWSLGKGPDGSVALGMEELTLAISQPKGYLYSLRGQPKLGDFALEITASPSICRGSDQYGLLLRVSEALDFYRFGLTCDGQAQVERVVQGRASFLKTATPSGAIPRGAPSLTRLAVSVVGKDMQFFANNEFLFSVRDPSLISGSLGLYARAAGEDAVTVNFSNLVIYQAGK